MQEIKEQTMVMILEKLSNAPESQIDSNITKLIKDFKYDDITELYDFIVGISNLSITTVSQFVISLCELDKHYKRP